MHQAATSWGSRLTSTSPFNATETRHVAPKDPQVASEVITNDKTFTTPAPTQAMTVSRNLVWLAFADGSLQIRNANTAAIVRRFEEQKAGGKGGRTGTTTTTQRLVRSMLAVVTMDAKCQVWLGLSNGTIEIRDSETGDVISLLKKHLADVYCLVEFGGLVYSGSHDHLIVQWRAEGGRCVRVLSGHEGPVRCLFAEGNALVSGADDCTVKVWDVGSGTMQLTGYFHSQTGGVSALCRVGENMWSGDNTGQIAVWKLHTCEAVQLTQPHKGRINALQKVGYRVYSASADGSIGILNSDTGSLLHMVEDQSMGWVTSVVWPSQLSRFVIWSAGADGVVRCWYQDEFQTMTADHARLNDSTWYLSGSTPYRELRESFTRENMELQEKLMGADGHDDLAMQLLRQCSVALGGGDATKLYDRIREQSRLAAERKQAAEKELQLKKDELSMVDHDIATTAQFLKEAQAELNSLDPGSANYVASAVAVPPSASEVLREVAAVAPGILLPGEIGAVERESTGITGALSGPSVSNTRTDTISHPTLASSAHALYGSLGGGGVQMGSEPHGTFSGGAIPLPTLGSGAYPAATGTGIGHGAPLGSTVSLDGQGSCVHPDTGNTITTLSSTGAVPPPPLPYPSAVPVPTYTTTASLQNVPAPVSSPSTAGVLSSYPQEHEQAGSQNVTGGVHVPTSCQLAQTPSPLGEGTRLGVPHTAFSGAYPCVSTATGTVYGGMVTPGAYYTDAGGVPAPPLAGIPAAAGVSGAVPTEHPLSGATDTEQLKGKPSSGVAWTNPNVGNYIQRRYYGAEPSLRTPDVQKRVKRKGRMPVVKVEPLKKGGAASTACGSLATVEIQSTQVSKSAPPSTL